MWKYSRPGQFDTTPAYDSICGRGKKIASREWNWIWHAPTTFSVTLRPSCGSHIELSVDERDECGLTLLNLSKGGRIFGTSLEVSSVAEAECPSFKASNIRGIALHCCGTWSPCKLCG